MIQTTTIPFGNSIACMAFYHDGFMKKVRSAWAADIFKAPGVCRRLEKEILREKLSRFLNQRQNIMEYHGGLRTEAKLKAWQTAKSTFDYLHDKDLSANCKFIVTAKHLFDELMPGEKSEYYASTKKLMEEMHAYCELKIVTV